MIGLIRHLKKFNNISQIIITNATNETLGISKFDNDEDITVYSLAMRRSAGYRILSNLLSTLKKIRYDIIHIHGYGEYTSNIVCILKKLGLIKTPIILTPHGIAGLKHGYLAMNPSFGLPLNERIARLLHLPFDHSLGRMEMKTFDKVVTSSVEEIKYLGRIGLVHERIINIPIAVNDIFFDNDNNGSCSSDESSEIYPPTHSLKEVKEKVEGEEKLQKQNRDYVLFVGRIDRFKGVDTVVRSIKHLRLFSKLDMRCILVGKDVGYKDKLSRLIKDLGITDLVEIRDQVSQEKLVNLYSSALVTVLPSSSEGFALAVVESMALGTPVIATPVGVVPEAINAAKAGIMIPINDSKSLATAIKTLRNDRKLWLEMSRNCRRYAKNYSWNIIARRYYDTYLEIISIEKKSKQPTNG